MSETRRTPAMTPTSQTTAATLSGTSAHQAEAKPAQGLDFQDLCRRLQDFWAERDCILQLPFDLEVGAGTMAPETFLRVLGRAPYRVAYLQPSRRPADGRYGENPNRLYKHIQLQVVLKPPPENIQQMYLESLQAIGIRLEEHDIKFEEDNWESPTLGAWGLGWQVMLDGLEITQFTYFQQCGGQMLDPVSVEITYGMERIAAFLQDVESVYDVRWNRRWSYAEVRREDEVQMSKYNFETANTELLWLHFTSYEKEATELLNDAKQRLKAEADAKETAGEPLAEDVKRLPLLGAYELCLKCSHLFNLLDARGAISVTERVGVIQRVRRLAVETAALWIKTHP